MVGCILLRGSQLKQRHHPPLTNLYFGPIRVLGQIERGSAASARDAGNGRSPSQSIAARSLRGRGDLQGAPTVDRNLTPFAPLKLHGATSNCGDIQCLLS